MKLFEPGRIGKLTLKNRIIMATMGNKLVEPDGRLSQSGIDFYVARAKGGTGLIITSAFHTRLIEQLPFTPLRDTLILDSRIYLGRLSDLAEAVHDYGTKVALQVIAGHGRTDHPEVMRSGTSVAPSPLPCISNPNVLARELTTAEVERLTQTFKLTAELAREAGIDAIEINAHGGHLPDEFLTELWNKRGDKYGGNLEGRLRFLLEIIENLKKGAGVDFPVIVKYGLTHYLEGGRDIEEGLEIARRLEAAGVDALEIDAGCYENRYILKPTSYSAPGCFVHLAEMVKEVVHIPVIVGGKLGYPELAEKVLREGKADFIALGRPLLADPEWANKVREQRIEDVAPCLGDFEGCNGRITAGKSISCTVNPACGMERELVLTLADRKKSVLVVGGGPGGMEAAIVAAIRGHKVTLCEKGSTLGGSLIPASMPDFKCDYRSLISYLSSQTRKLKVEVKLATEVTPNLVDKMKPDVVFLATGSVPIIPEIPTTDKEKVVTAIDALMGRKEIGKSVIVIGGGSIGCETALYLARKGKKVSIIEILDSILRDIYVANRMHLMKLLADSNVGIMTGTRVLEITGKGVTTVDKASNKGSLEADTVVIAVGLKPNEELFGALKDKAPEVYGIGDCVKPRKVLDAIREGFRLARLI